jgi:hypothetical protein
MIHFCIFNTRFSTGHRSSSQVLFNRYSQQVFGARTLPGVDCLRARHQRTQCHIPNSSKFHKSSFALADTRTPSADSPRWSQNWPPNSSSGNESSRVPWENVAVNVPCAVRATITTVPPCCENAPKHASRWAAPSQSALPIVHSPTKGTALFWSAHVNVPMPSVQV